MQVFDLPKADERPFRAQVRFEHLFPRLYERASVFYACKGVSRNSENDK